MIAVCGIDGAGKTTLIETLARSLGQSGEAVHVTRQPTSFYRGLEPVRTYHDEGACNIPAECLALLSAADRSLHLAQEVLPALMAGKTVISDRFVAAAAAIFETRGLSRSWIDEVNRFCPPPHGQILLDISGEAAVERIRQRGGYIRLEERSAETLEAIRQNYLRQRQENCLVLNALESPESIADQAGGYVTSMIKRSAHA
ncbi:dTMP kinase [Streptomyces collinus]|uniref:dTMP kinase n=1 Tax=Streptomyces collinus TaxID=42684 RepID=UPI0029426CC4|nr:dTMP kinase [Streptomyces collinus]